MPRAESRLYVYVTTSSTANVRSRTLVTTPPTTVLSLWSPSTGLLSAGRHAGRRDHRQATTWSYGWSLTTTRHVIEPKARAFHATTRAHVYYHNKSSISPIGAATTLSISAVGGWVNAHHVGSPDARQFAHAQGHRIGRRHAPRHHTGSKRPSTPMG